MHCEHKFQRQVDQIFKCKLCGKVIYKSKKVLLKDNKKPCQPNQPG